MGRKGKGWTRAFAAMLCAGLFICAIAPDAGGARGEWLLDLAADILFGDDETSVGVIGGADGPTAIFVAGEEAEDNAPGDEAVLAEDGVYTDKDDVALYLHTYKRLPDNFITKNEARKLGWEGGSLEPYAPGKAIGGDAFGNREGLLPKAKGRSYKECDIGTLGKNSRGAKRVVYSSDGLIYYSDDHYESFTLLYDEEGPAR